MTSTAATLAGSGDVSCLRQQRCSNGLRATNLDVLQNSLERPDNCKFSEVGDESSLWRDTDAVASSCGDSSSQRNTIRQMKPENSSIEVSSDSTLSAILSDSHSPYEGNKRGAMRWNSIVFSLTKIILVCSCNRTTAICPVQELSHAEDAFKDSCQRNSLAVEISYFHHCRKYSCHWQRDGWYEPESMIRQFCKTWTSGLRAKTTCTLSSRFMQQRPSLNNSYCYSAPFSMPILLIQLRL